MVNGCKKSPHLIPQEAEEGDRIVGSKLTTTHCVNMPSTLKYP